MLRLVKDLNSKSKLHAKLCKNGKGQQPIANGSWNDKKDIKFIQSASYTTTLNI